MKMNSIGAFGAIDISEDDSVPTELFDSDFNRLRDDILDRLDKGISVATTQQIVNPFLVQRNVHNPFIVRRRITTPFKDLQPPSEIDKIKNKTTQVIDIPEELQELFIENLDVQNKNIRDFLITDIAPISIGLDTAIEEAIEMLQIIMDDKTLNFTSSKVHELTRELITIKIVDRISTNLGISNDIFTKLLDAYLTKYQQPKQQVGNNPINKLVTDLIRSNKVSPSSPKPKSKEVTNE